MVINKALRILWIYNGIFVFAGGLLGPLYAVYAQNITTSPLAISMSWAVFLVSSVLFTYFVSKVGDSIPQKEYLLIAGFVVRGVVWALYIFVDSLTFLLILQLILGIGEALGSPAFGTLVAEHLDKGRHVEEYSDMLILFNLSAALAALVGGAIVSQFGFATLFVLMSVMAFISAIGVYIKPRRLL